MSVKYHNLDHEIYWMTLFRNLLRKSGRCTDDVKATEYVQKVFGGEIINGAILLFQALSPIRFAFLDGQARMAAMHFFTRKILPCLDGSVVPLKKDPNNHELSKQWTLERTGEVGTCFFAQDISEADWPNVTPRCIEYLTKTSKTVMEEMMAKWKTLDQIAPSNLSDCISCMIHLRQRALQANRIVGAIKLHVTLTFLFGKVLEAIRDFDTRLREVLFNRIRNVGTSYIADANYITNLYSNIYVEGTKKRFPSLQSPIKGGAPQLTVLMLILGTGLVNKESTALLQKCINKDWMVPVVGHVRGVPIDDLHPGTYIGGSGNRTLFHENYYLVS